MRLLGGPSGVNGSPRLWTADNGIYFAQGYPVPGEPTQVRIPHDLLDYMEPGTCFDTELADIGNGWYVLAGATITDQQILDTMQIPDHETAVAVPVRKGDR